MTNNAFAPSGFRPSRNYLASAPNFAVQECLIAYNYGSKIAKGDPVVGLANGTIGLMSVGGTTIKGIFLGCEYYDPVAQLYRFLPYWPAPGTLVAGAVVKARVLADPFAEFEVQLSSAAGITQSIVGSNVDILAGSSGAPNLAGISTCAADATTIANTATLPFRITGIVQQGPSSTYDPTGAYPWVEVRMNTSDALQTTGI